MEGRLAVLVAMVVIVFGGFGVRLFQLQILRGEELAGRAEGNAVRLLRLEASRGDILDREGRVIATTRPAFAVSAMPSDLREPERTFAALGDLLDAEPEQLRERFGTPKGRRRFQPVELLGDIPFDNKSRVEAHLFELPGVLSEWRPRRHYVGGELAAHLLGTIGEIGPRELGSSRYEGYRSGEVIGQSGVERLLESHLRGRAGGRNVVVDVSGRVVRELEKREPEPGGRVKLTLDLDLQGAAESGFLPEVLGGQPKMGALIALDPRNGDVLAFVSKPSFDPNDFAGGIDSATWKQLRDDEWRPLQNRAISGQYPPGSAFKPIVAAATLVDGVLGRGERVFCPGWFRLGRRTYRCWKRVGHGSVDLRDALKQSCDVYFYQVGVLIGVDRIADFARAFGLGRPTGFPFGDESSGLVPTQSWKARRFGEPWQKGETVSTAIGQGFNLVTPLQLAVAYAAIANGGVLLRPRVVLERTAPDGTRTPAGAPEVVGHLPVAPEQLAVIRDALEAVVEEPQGTGGRSRIPGVRVAGKTGTAQVVRLKHTEHLDEDEIPIRYRDHAWFVAFAPVEAPEIVVSVLVEHGGHGGAAAAPIAQKVLATYFEKQRDDVVETVAVRTSAGESDAGR